LNRDRGRNMNRGTGTGCGDLLQFLSVSLAKAARVGTIQNSIRRRGQGGLAGLPVIQRILQGSTDRARLIAGSVRLRCRGGDGR